MTTMTKQPENTARTDSQAARRAMIDSQLRTSGVNEEFVLGRMIAVPREDFLPEDKAPLAYIDRAVALGEDTHLASPLFYGKLMLEADPVADDRVLILEGGTSYLSQLMRPLVSDVTSVGIADVKAGKVAGSYSLILVDGAIETLPEALVGALEDNGRIVSGLVLRKVTRLASGQKVGGKVSLQPVEDLGMPVLHAFDKPQSWTF